MITRSEYEEARAAIDKAATQLETDGRVCAICEDTDHSAWGCRFNPVLAMKQRDRLSALLDEMHERIHQNQCT